MHHIGLNTDDYNGNQTGEESVPGTGHKPGTVVISEKAMHDQT